MLFNDGMITEIESNRKQMHLLEKRVMWLEQMIDANKDSHQSIVSLRRTIGSDMWLDGLNDDEWRMLWDQIVPRLLKAAKMRGEEI